MDLESARKIIQTAVDRMRACYLQPVFDEWAILSMAAKGGGIVAYNGPRSDVFRRNLPTDAEPLRAATAGREFAEGDIEFVPDAADTRYDAFMKVGAHSYLVLNHTVKTMNEIRADAKWFGAQAVLFELSEKFRVDPLVG
ncbi:hypothetical protein [Horticoccus sp. 23ND18S-11]|uniref:hypothetical protein n=1 Tax=Horticoccus sp. 23ND18S-11 TaxID=3391832 RepID=UPI0039C8F6CE